MNAPSKFTPSEHQFCIELEERYCFDETAGVQWPPGYSQRNRPQLPSGQRIHLGSPVEAIELIRLRFEVGRLAKENARLKRDAVTIAANIIREIVRITTSIFGYDVKVSESFDPEFPDDKFTLFTVETELDARSIVDAEQDWIENVVQLGPSLDFVRLLVFPKP